jgi:hypothetical protein
MSENPPPDRRLPVAAVILAVIAVILVAAGILWLAGMFLR